MSEPLVTAIIPSRSGGAGLAASVAALAPSPDLEVVVVLNDADAETTAVADGLGDVTVLRSPVNRGFGGGVDLAAAAARSRVLLITHDDATIVPGSIERLVAAFERHDHLGAVAGAGAHRRCRRRGEDRLRRGRLRRRLDAARARARH